LSNANHNHQNAAGGGTIAESALSFTDITTNNASSSKHGLLPKLSGVATDVLHGDGTYSPATPTQIMISTIFETAARFNVSGTITFDANGALMNTGGTGSASYNPSMGWVLCSTGVSLLDGNAQFGVNLSLSQGSTAIGTIYIGAGNPNSGGVPLDTTVHLGWKIIGAAGNQQLFATIGNGTTGATSAALLSNLALNDQLELLVVMNGNTSATFYYRKNGGVQASTTISANIPAAAASNLTQIFFETSNNNTANVFGCQLRGAFWAR
jgi:hypothetical protein